MTSGKQQRLAAEQKRGKLLDNKVHTGISTLNLAEHFSHVVERHLSLLVELFNMRGIVAHRTDEEFDEKKCRRFLRKHFFPLINEFQKELGCAELKDFFSADTMEELQKLADGIEVYDGSPERIARLTVKHVAIWNERKSNAQWVAETLLKTEGILKACKYTYTIPIQCPVCQQPAVMFQDSLGEAPSGGTIYGVGLYCLFCGLDAGDYEDIDALRLMGSKEID